MCVSVFVTMSVSVSVVVPVFMAMSVPVVVSEAVLVAMPVPVTQSCPRVTFLGPDPRRNVDPTRPGETLTRPGETLTRPDPAKR